MSRVIEGFEALLLLTLAVIFGGAIQQVREKSKRVLPVMWPAARVAITAFGALVLIKYTSDKVVGFLYDRWHLLAYALIVVAAAGLTCLFRRSKKMSQLVWLVILLASATGVVLHLFW
jgi:cytochrome bd-type quinol oxidase subunit 2